MHLTDIQWTRFAANPLKYRRQSDGKTVWACVKTSPGCAHCYSEALALRYERGKLFNAANMDELEPFLDEAEMRKMLTAKTVGGVQVSGSRCFVGDMTDCFGDWVPDELLDRLFAVFALRDDVTWQVLTKRAERMAEYMLSRSKSAKFWKDAARTMGYSLQFEQFSLVPFPLPNLWLGVSVENQDQADKRIPFLLQTPAAVRFISAEPLLGPVDLLRVDAADFGGQAGHKIDCIRKGYWSNGPLGFVNHSDMHDQFGPLHWVIVGSESGHKRRRMETAWAESIIRQCQAAGVAIFMKQMEIGGKVSGDVESFPESLRVREFPKMEVAAK